MPPVEAFKMVKDMMIDARKDSIKALQSEIASLNELTNDIQGIKKEKNK